MKKTLFIPLLFLSIITYCQDISADKGLKAINRSVIQAQLQFLASDWMEGRRTGERGELISSDYIASMLQLYGIKPWGDSNISSAAFEDPANGGRSFFQNFILHRTTAGVEQSLHLRNTEGGTTKTIIFTNNIDFTVRPSASMEVEAPVVFAGYGFINEKLGFNDLSKTDVRGKFILRIAGSPAFATKKLPQSEIISSKREFETIVRSRGAAGIIDVNPDAAVFGPVTRQIPDMSPAERTPRPGGIDARYSIPGTGETDKFVRLNISLKTANEILSGTGNSIEEYRRKADAGQPFSFQLLPGKALILKTSVITEKIPVRNILGIIEGNNNNEIIVLGAHYDHMGMNNGYIWNGADDNASGTVGIMTLAKAIMETGKKPEKTVVIALWTAEEQGLLGSAYFVANLPVPRDHVKLNVNFDMISRYVAENQKNKVVMTYTASQPGFRELTDRNLKKYGIDLDVEYQPSNNPPGGSDHRSFVAAGIPIMRFKPGHRAEYHTPADEVSTVDWDIMEKIIKISFANIWQLANTNW